jgi:starch synthase
MHLTGLGWELFTPDGLEYYGKINLMKGGLIWSHIINTISPTYAQEIQTRDFGHGLDGVLQYRRDDLYGVVNGVDYTVWNPASDTLITSTYTPGDLSGKDRCKQALLQEHGLPEKTSVPVLAMISPLENQKGCDLLADILEQLMERDLYLLISGTGHEKYQKLFQRMVEKYPQKIGLHLEFDQSLIHRVLAGADMLLMPSRQEPCGENQLYALKYGTVPIVRATGGLHDTVEPFRTGQDTGTGFAFSEYEPEALLNAIIEALNAYQDQETWKALMLRGMQQDFSWDASAQAYEQLYQKAIEQV